MKKIMMLLIVAVLMLGVSGQAMAAFTQGDLIQVVYQKGGSMEVATDLGAFSATTLASAPQNVALTANPFPVAGSGVFSGAAASDLQIAYYVVGPGATTFWTSGPEAGQTSGARQGTAVQTMNTVNGKYASLGGSQVTLAQSDGQSYYSLGDKGGNGVGGFAGFIPANNGEQNLGALATVGYVDSYLYYYATPGATTAKAGVQVATIRSYADGTSIINPTSVSQTPIPAAVYLLGSGLLGFVGIRRKMAA